MYSDLKGKGLEVLLVTFREDPELVRKTVEERRYIAPVLIDRTGDVTGRVYGVFGPPTVFLIDRTGRLVGRGVGSRQWESPAGRKLMMELLQAPPSRTRS